MLNRIRRFFDTHLGAAPTDQDPAARCAAAALLLEMAHMDDAMTAVEQAAIVAAVREHFGLSPE